MRSGFSFFLFISSVFFLLVISSSVRGFGILFSISFIFLKRKELADLDYFYLIKS